MKSFTILATIILCSFLFSCSKKGADAVYVTFINHTGQDINNTTVDNISIGNIPNNGQTGLLKFSSFSTDSGLPFCTFKGQHNSQSMEGLTQFPGCGTERRPLKNGTYTIEVKISQFNSTDYFDLSFK